jgi:hypothetical protein
MHDTTGANAENTTAITPGQTWQGIPGMGNGRAAQSFGRRDQKHEPLFRRFPDDIPSDTAALLQVICAVQQRYIESVCLRFPTGTYRAYVSDRCLVIIN